MLLRAINGRTNEKDNALMYTIVNKKKLRQQMGTKALSSPIAMLPPELMRGVIRFVVSSYERHAILQLSQVSRSFRQTVLDMSWLFTIANWDRWSTSLLDLWCQRARAQPLTVSLSEGIIHCLTDGKAPELKALWESYSRHWGTLILQICPGADGGGMIRFVERLLQCACPLLRTITIICEGYASSAIPLHLHPDCLPSLQALYLDGILPISSTSLTSVTEFTFSCQSEKDWLPLLDAVKGCCRIQRLMIGLSDYYGYNPIVFPVATSKAVLSSLTHLEIEGMDVRLTAAAAISQFLGHCDIPKLKSLNVRIRYPWSPGPEAFEILCQSLVRR